ncbi:MAG: LysM peptidoglycan-binding domain-containing protein [Chloroflexota bacterium]
MESDQKQARLRPTVVIVCLMLAVSLLVSALPTMQASAVTCKFKHTVVAGDTLMYVANLYQADWNEIAQANNLQPPYAIAVGQVLCIPEGTKPGNSGTSTDTKKGKKEATLDVVSQMNHIYVSVENFANKTPYYVRVFNRTTGVSYRIGNFTTNKEGDWAGWFKVPGYMPRTVDMGVCVKNTWTDAVSCVKYDDSLYTLPVVLLSRCIKQGR